VITLEECINGCFKRSMNGKPLPPDSPDMKAMAAYFDWMKRETKPQDKVPGRGVGKIDCNIQPYPVNGKKVYVLDQGGLSDQDAVDVAESFSHPPRPDFSGKLKDWPKDKKPADARY